MWASDLLYTNKMYSWNNKVEIQINSEKSPFLFFCILIWTLNNFQWWFIKGAVVETNRMALNGTLKTLPPKKQKKQKTKLMKHSSVIQQRRSCSKLRTQQMGGSRIPPEWGPNGSSKFRASAQLQWCSSSTLKFKFNDRTIHNFLSLLNTTLFSLS